MVRNGTPPWPDAHGAGLHGAAGESPFEPPAASVGTCAEGGRARMIIGIVGRAEPPPNRQHASKSLWALGGLVGECSVSEPWANSSRLALH